MEKYDSAEPPLRDTTGCLVFRPSLRVCAGSDPHLDAGYDTSAKRVDDKRRYENVLYGRGKVFEEKQQKARMKTPTTVIP
jgi:hypothetical protein